MKASTVKRRSAQRAGTSGSGSAAFMHLPVVEPGPEKTARSERIYDSIADLIADPDNPTPMVRVSRRFNAEAEFEVFIKLESFNPFGSIKDRTALYMMRGTPLGPNQVLTEPTAGNTGIALAGLANVQGVQIELAVPEATPTEKTTLLRLLGAGILEVEDELCPLFPTEGARGVVKSLVESEALKGKYVSPNQYESELNIQAHYQTTGPEIWKQTGGNIDYFFAALGTCGTITGVGRFLKEQNPNIRIFAVEPTLRNHRLSGIKKVSDLPEEFAPRILDRSVVDEIIAVNDEDAYKAGIRIARTDGLLVGPTTGAILHAAQVVGAGKKGRAVVISPDDATKYLSAYAEYL